MLTVGHGRLDRFALAEQLHSGGVQRLVDVRRFPGSRHNPDVSSEALSAWLPQEEIEYRWDERLGGRRTMPTAATSPDVWWKVEAFRAYAAHTRTEDFVDAVEELLAGAKDGVTAIMCSESVWWRCHRRLIADVVLLGHAMPVSHLMPEGRTSIHRPSAGARLQSPGLLVWDGQPGAG